MFLSAFSLLDLTDQEKRKKVFSLERNAQLQFLRVLRVFWLIASGFLLGRKQSP